MFIPPNVCKILRLCHIFAHFQRITLDLGKLTEFKAHFSAGLMNFRLVIYVESYKAKVERLTSILGLCHGVFTDQFIFRHILGHLFPRK